MVYLLETSKSNWDEYEHIVIGIATCPFEADKLKQEWLVKLKENQLKYSEEDYKRLYEEYEEFDEDNLDLPMYLNDFIKWNCSFYKDYSDEVKITEIKENTIICNNLND